MNITFLIGNGLDVGLGMKSRFKDFFPIYKEKSAKKPKKIRQLSEEIDADYETWADFETALGEYTMKFNAETKQDFLDQVKDFQNEFIEHLQIQEEGLDYNKQDLAGFMINALMEYYSSENLPPESNKRVKSIHDLYNYDEHTYNFVNFNYTYSLEKCLNTIPQKIVCKRKYGNGERVDRIGEIVHVHGRRDLYPLIGVNDVSQIANEELAKDATFIRRIVKPTLNRSIHQENDENATTLINQSQIICVYGMSLGKTDKKWWDLLMKWLKGSDYRQLVIFDYDEKYTTSSPYAWMDKEDSILDKLNEYNADPKIKIDSLCSRIHIAVHKNIFQIDLRPQQQNLFELCESMGVSVKEEG